MHREIDRKAFEINYVPTKYFFSYRIPPIFRKNVGRRGWDWIRFLAKIRNFAIILFSHVVCPSPYLAALHNAAKRTKKNSARPRCVFCLRQQSSYVLKRKGEGVKSYWHCV